MMTLDEAIADVAKGTIVENDSLISWRARMLRYARGGSGYSWGVINGAYGQRPARVCVALEDYWRAHGPPAQPEPEWVEVETPAVQVAGIDVELRVDGEFVYVNFHTPIRGRFRIRQYDGRLRGGLVIEREVSE